MSDERYILLVEDDPRDEALTLRALRKGNVANPVMVVRDGAEALDFLFAEGAYTSRNGAPAPQVILLDLKLPKVDGLEVLARLRAHQLTKLIPIVVLTSSVEDQDLVRSYSLGANSYVRKPVDFDEFVSAARHLGVYWLLLNEPPPDGVT